MVELWRLLWLLQLSVTAIRAYTCPMKCKCTDEHQLPYSMVCKALGEQDLIKVKEVLTTIEWSHIRELTIVNSPAFQFEHLPSLKNLEVLNLSSNSLKMPWNAQYNRFPSVTKLIVEKNEIAEMSRNYLLQFPMLEELHCGQNQITSSGLDSLRMPKMRVIHLNDNNITFVGTHTLRFMPYLSEVNFSGNQLVKFATSDYSLVGGLRYLNLARNRISSLECDTINAMPSLEILDLSFNRLGKLPVMELSDMEGLRTLNLSGNPIKIAGDRPMYLPHIKVLDLSQTGLKVIEHGAFSTLRELHTLNLSKNKDLLYISPTALENNTLLYSLDLSNTSLKLISPSFFKNVAQIRLAGSPLDCGCVLDQFIDIATTTMSDWDKTTCKTRSGKTIEVSHLKKALLHQDDYCRPEAILPFGSQMNASIGQTFTIYCAGTEEDEEITWKAPNGETFIGKRAQKISGLEQLDYFTSTLFEPQAQPVARPRIIATTEYYRIDVVLESDLGVYECSVKRGERSVSRKIYLNVKKPKIDLDITTVGISTLHITWNANLDVQAADRVSLQIDSRNGESDYRRAVQISLKNVYCSYNMINLSPNTNYTVCIRWLLTDDNSEIYSSCVRTKTQRIKSILDEVSPEVLLTICCLIGITIGLYCIRKLWTHLHVYSTAKKQSKLIQSVSGQSILSQSISSDATMYENHQLELTSSLNSSRSDPSNGPLLQHV